MREQSRVVVEGEESERRCRYPHARLLARAHAEMITTRPELVLRVRSHPRTLERTARALPVPLAARPFSGGGEDGEHGTREDETRQGVSTRMWMVSAGFGMRQDAVWDGRAHLDSHQHASTRALVRSYTPRLGLSCRTSPGL